MLHCPTIDNSPWMVEEDGKISQKQDKKRRHFPCCHCGLALVEGKK
jgi:hypothetical protein